MSVQRVWHLTGHMVIHIPAAHGGPDWTAIVSAGAAVAQAIGAIGAIIFSVRIANAAAEREKKANQAALERIVAADAAAERRVAREREERERSKRESDIARRNNLIDIAISYGKATVDEFQLKLAEANRIAAGELAMRYVLDVGHAQDIAGTRLQELEGASEDVSVALCIRELRSAVRPFLNNLPGGGAAWAAALSHRLREIEGAIDALSQKRLV